MFNVGGPEIMVVILVALVVLGPEQLPKAMRSFGNVMAQVRKVSNGFQDEMRSAMNSLDQPTGSGTASSPAGGSANSAASAPDAGSTPSTSTPSTSTPSTSTPSTSTEPGSSTTGSSTTGSSTTGSRPTSPAAPFVDPVTDRPGVSPADRAAG